MIVDGGSLELVNTIESLLQDATEGKIKPELMESVLEITTSPATTRSRRDELRSLRRQVPREPPMKD